MLCNEDVVCPSAILTSYCCPVSHSCLTATPRGEAAQMQVPGESPDLLQLVPTWLAVNFTVTLEKGIAWLINR